jgi:hypothetical protein
LVQGNERCDESSRGWNAEQNIDESPKGLSRVIIR